MQLCLGFQTRWCRWTSRTTPRSCLAQRRRSWPMWTKRAREVPTPWAAPWNQQTLKWWRGWSTQRTSWLTCSTLTTPREESLGLATQLILWVMYNLNQADLRRMALEEQVTTVLRTWVMEITSFLQLTEWERLTKLLRASTPMNLIQQLIDESRWQ